MRIMKKTDMTLPDNHRIDEEKCKSLLQYIRLNVTEKYDFPQEIVQVDGVTVDVGQFQRIDRKAQKQENVQCQRHRGLCPVGERGAEIQGGAAALQEPRAVH